MSIQTPNLDEITLDFRRYQIVDILNIHMTYTSTRESHDLPNT